VVVFGGVGGSPDGRTGSKQAKCNRFKRRLVIDLATSPLPFLPPLFLSFLACGFGLQDARSGRIGMDRVSPRIQNVCPDASVRYLTLIDYTSTVCHNRSISTFAGFLLARRDILSSLTARGASQIILVRFRIQLFQRLVLNASSRMSLYLRKSLLKWSPHLILLTFPLSVREEPTLHFTIAHTSFRQFPVYNFPDSTAFVRRHCIFNRSDRLDLDTLPMLRLLSGFLHQADLLGAPSVSTWNICRCWMG